MKFSNLINIFISSIPIFFTGQKSFIPNKGNKDLNLVTNTEEDSYIIF